MVEAIDLDEVCEPGELYLVGSDESEKLFTFRQALEMLRSSFKGITQRRGQYVRPTNVPRLFGDTSKFRSKPMEAKNFI